MNHVVHFSGIKRGQKSGCLLSRPFGFLYNTQPKPVSLYLRAMLHTDRILILAPHTDDGELGCGASIAKYTAAGKQVIYAAFSTCSQSLPAHLAANTLAAECKAATAVLGIRELLLFDFDVRQFPSRRQEILETLVQLNKTLSPQTVFLPAENDVHQDHGVIFAEGLRAFKNSNVLGYELPWNNVRFSPNYFEKIDQQQLAAKNKALACYASQAHRSYINHVFTEDLATVRGVQCNTALAEAFEIYRMCS